jgi:hypothetical protein
MDQHGAEGYQETTEVNHARFIYRGEPAGHRGLIRLSSTTYAY